MPFTAPCRAITNSLHSPNDDEVDNTAQRLERAVSLTSFMLSLTARISPLPQTGAPLPIRRPQFSLTSDRKSRAFMKKSYLVIIGERLIGLRVRPMLISHQRKRCAILYGDRTEL
jgi:hypothetical protein